MVSCVQEDCANDSGVRIKQKGHYLGPTVCVYVCMYDWHICGWLGACLCAYSVCVCGQSHA